MTVTCLSIRQPWAWLIAAGYKDIENRTWHSRYRGLLYIHASKTMTRKEYDECRLFTLRISNRNTLIGFPRFESLERGAIIGRAMMTDCLSAAEAPKSPWFNGPYGFQLEQAELLTPSVPYPGVLGFFQVEALFPS